MIAIDLITDSIPPVKTTDHLSTALNWMEEFKIAALPVIEGEFFKGMITEQDVLDAADLELNIGEAQYAGWDSAYVRGDKHFFDVLHVLGTLGLGAVAVVDGQKRYLGLITARELAVSLSRYTAFGDVGGVLVLSVPSNGYALSEIGRIAESADVKVLGLFLDRDNSDGSYRINLKLNVEDLSRVQNAFERFNYKVLGAYQQSIHRPDLEQSYEALMRYLDV